MTRLSTRETLRAATAKPPVYVRIVTQRSDGTEEAKEIDWNKSSDKKWLMTRHLHWAILNGHSVTLFIPESN
jgi:hypothetical protein